MIMKKIYVFLADGFEEIEGLTVVDLLRRAGLDVVTVSIKEEKRIMGGQPGSFPAADGSGEGLRGPGKESGRDLCRAQDLSRIRSAGRPQSHLLSVGHG